MSGDGKNHRRRRHAGLLRPRAVARRLHRHQDALGAAGGHIADGALAVEEVGRHRDHLGLEPLEAGECDAAEAVLGEERGVRLLGHLEDVLARVVHEAPHPALAPPHVALSCLAEKAADLVTGLADRWKLHRFALLLIASPSADPAALDHFAGNGPATYARFPQSGTDAHCQIGAPPLTMMSP